MLRADAATRFLVLEMGARHIGDIAELTGLVAPGGTAVLNADDPRVVAMRALTDGPVLTFGRA
jgi:UDP-N-acetylmuramoyl-tripeptide--D-alanyl-D-alanine ligase